MPVAVQKAMDQARRSMIKVPLKNGTIHHEVIGRHGATKVFMQPAKEGSGGALQDLCVWFLMLWAFIISPPKCTDLLTHIIFTCNIRWFV